MKKLMIGLAAAGLCTAVFADVSSANVVGYLNQTAYADGHSMQTPTFANPGTLKKYTLADLSVDGYVRPHFTGGSWRDGCPGGYFILKFLKNTGKSDAEYYWIDYKFGFSEETPMLVQEPGWYKWLYYSEDDDEDIYEKLTPAELAEASFDQGQSFWVLGTGKQLVAAGQVTKQELVFTCNADGHSAIGNGMPVEYTLGDLSVDGYVKPHFTGGSWRDGCPGGYFILKFLKNTGKSDAEYYWIDYKFGFSEEAPMLVQEPGWYKWLYYSEDDDEDVYEKLTPAELDEITVPAGQGFWVLGTGKQLIVPGVSL